MNGGIQNLNAGATGQLSTLDWPAWEPTKILSNGFWAVALLSAIGLAVSLSLSYVSPCTGIDLNIGCNPIEMTGQMPE
jgi:hypothetical protein